MTLVAKSRREATKLCGLCLDHYGVLNDITGAPCIIEVYSGDNRELDQDMCSSHKLWKMSAKIYSECIIAAPKVRNTHGQLIFSKTQFAKL